MGQAPWENSLWIDCLFQLIAKARKEGEESVSFEDVDKLVVEKSKLVKHCDKAQALGFSY